MGTFPKIASDFWKTFSKSFFGTFSKSTIKNIRSIPHFPHFAMISLIYLFIRTATHRQLLQYASSSHKKQHVLLVYQAYAMYNSTNSIIIIHSRRNPAYLRIVPKSSYVFQHRVPAQANRHRFRPGMGRVFHRCPPWPIYANFGP